MQLFGPALPNGLTIVEEFLTVSEHDNCLGEIDSQPWSTDLNRRTQHYGSKYDYTTGKAVGAGSAPEPPAPLREVAAKLVGSGFYDVEPDQIIVNEYVVDDENVQGIAAHRDRTDSFGPVIATVSLNESWAMRFTNEEESVEAILPVRSVAVMTGDARYVWKHSVPPRKFDTSQSIKIRRHRRVSLTFRSLR